jgi:formylmethanofuran dehydrogenase subunit E
MIVYEDGEVIIICDNCGEEIFDTEYEESPDGQHFCSECLKNLYAQEQ